ncbi:hypothetical protein BU24DRAFT_419891 [Aaosphaeria arxii CBS 175.79]|uniref:Uncharacterized protein n=1 Tax=Aaosphaeria arxii CBS 175.79 TaxID=1450172 RepID=A0A6A5XU32_9PLEO|nr:uncharacterized protein BU24DRAFT_419891 [Aaosphaeria arxii CBS 175.79]KAF2016828.1 hypothetical protein BU24DRAFT_419891 [Aaosphaeria arxii CBS 175.79]
MTSIIGSDLSLFTRFFDNGRAAIAGSAVDRIVGSKRVGQLSAVIGNRACDSALQINGHIIDTINNFNPKYIIIHCDSLVLRPDTGTRVVPFVHVEPRNLSLVNRPVTRNTVSSAEISTLRKQKQNVTIISNATGEPATFCVLFPQRVQDNFISLEIVTRLGLKAHYDTASVRSIVWEPKRLFSTGDLVDLSFLMPGSNKRMTRRFHVVEGCPFDMLLGPVATGLSLT